MPARKDRIQTLRHGDIAAITFWDHCQNGPATEFRVYGLVTGMTKEWIEVTAWGYADTALRHDENETRFSIVRSAITEQRRLR